MKAFIPEILQIFSALSFVFYGIMSFSSDIMKSEFNRWGISKFRTIVGCAQLTGGFGLLAGILFSSNDSIIFIRSDCINVIRFYS